jgi:hypothetical protein
MSFESFQNNIKELNKVLDDNSKFGTWDSEVVYKVRRLVKRAFDTTVILPKTPSAWEIYSDMEGADYVAEQLHIAMTRVIESINSLTVKDLKNPEFVRFFSEYQME